MKNYCKVLIIDDEFIMRQGMKHMLQWEKEGFTVVGEASNGAEALELIEKLKPNIILCDIVMPVLNGVDFTKIVQDKYPEIQIIILSSYDNFEYVKATFLNGVIDYVLKPTLNPLELLLTLKKAADKIPSLQLNKDEDIHYNKLIERYILGFDGTLNKMNFTSKFPHSCFRIFGINLKEASANNYLVSKKIKEELNNFIDKQQDYSTVKVFINEEILFYIINYKISENEKVLLDVKNIAQSIAYNNQGLFFVLSKEFNDIGSIKKIYQEDFAKLLKRKFYYKNTYIFIADKQQHNSEEIAKFNFKEYANILKKQEITVALAMVKEYINQCMEVKLQEYELKNLTKNLLYNMLVMLEDSEIDFDDLRYEIFKTIDNSLYIDDFKIGLESIFTKLTKIISNIDNIEEDKIKEILRYIKSHYQEHLDLKEISKVFNFNYYYLSSYFNTHSREGFSEYLNKVRIERACQLLREGKTPVAEVSSIVGYSDHSYFCRVFKKITGDTPSSYRRSELRKGGVFVEG